MASLIETRDVHMHFGHVIALAGISFMLEESQVHCLLGDNGAGKSTLIKILSGVFRPSAGEYLVEGTPARFTSPRDALDAGIATVFQDLAMVPLMSITRNFFMGREPVRAWGPLRIMDFRSADRVAREEMRRIGIDLRDPGQAVGTLSGGERQCLAIARAVYFGARVLILDEPTSALGVAQTSMVLRYVHLVREKGLGVIFITHNVRHAMAVGDEFTVLDRGRIAGRFRRGEATLESLQALMAGGKELAELATELGGTV
ncbi:MAG: ATP-binding cassette domain-containing protein [Rhodospirillales bacterium]|nr:ATP-binding cassette domain-containing protein [Rhodospirillales bacterium]